MYQYVLDHLGKVTAVLVNSTFTPGSDHRPVMVSSSEAYLACGVVALHELWCNI